MSDELAIEASGLTKSYRGVPALRGIDLRVPRGTVFALLGPNGAGKTTAVRILGTLQRADRGQAAGRGLRRGPRAATRSAAGYQPDRPVRRSGRGADGRGEPRYDRPAGRPAAGGRPAAPWPSSSSSSS